MAQYRRITVNLPDVLAAAFEKRLGEVPYSSESNYFVSLFLFDIGANRKHLTTPDTINKPGKLRDKLFATAARDYMSGKGKDGKTWLDHEIDRRVQEELDKRSGPRLL